VLCLVECVINANVDEALVRSGFVEKPIYLSDTSFVSGVIETGCPAFYCSFVGEFGDTYKVFVLSKHISIEKCNSKGVLVSSLYSGSPSGFTSIDVVKSALLALLGESCYAWGLGASLK
jgi:hypothetical protein